MSLGAKVKSTPIRKKRADAARPTLRLEEPASEKVLLSSGTGAELVELNFKEHSSLIDAVVEQATPLLEFEPQIKLYGKMVRQPRNVGFFSDVASGYFYSRTVMVAQPLTKEMEDLLSVVNARCNGRFNAMLVNKYANGTKSVSAHCDKNTMGTAGVVAISAGVTRKFRIRDVNTKAIVGDFDARHHMALQMKGPFQEQYTHEITVGKTIKDARVSLTFRQHDPVLEARMFEKARGKGKA